MQKVFLRHSMALIPKVQELAALWPEDHLYWLQYRNYPGSLYEKHLDWEDGTLSHEIELIEGPGQTRKILHYGYAPPREFIDEMAQKYDTAYVCGVDTDACVYAAMISLWDAEVRPVLLSDYCGSSGGKNFHDAALSLMHRQFGMDCVISGIPKA